MDLMLGEQYEVVSPENIIRFHVKAHSNRPEDIKVKTTCPKTICLYGSRWNGCCNKQELKGCFKDQKSGGHGPQYSQRKGVAEDVKVLLEKALSRHAFMR